MFGRYLRIARHRLRSLFKKDQLDSDLAREFAFHVEELARENMAAGMRPEEAQRAARRSVGNVAILQDECRDQRRVGWIHDLWQDIRYGFRMFRNKPGFTAVTVVSLALGVGANTAILAQIDAVAHGMLPYAAADRLVVIRTFRYENPDQLTNASLTDYLAWKQQSHSFESLGASFPDQADTGRGEDGTAPEHLTGRRFSQELLPTLGIKPLAGRLFSEADYQPSVSVALISYELWQRRFRGDSGVLNKEMRLNNAPFTIIGIMPPFFPYGPELVNYWTPLPIVNARTNTARAFTVMARLKTGMAIKQAQTEMDAIALQLSKDFPERNKGWGIRVQPLRDFLYGWAKPTLLTLEAAAAFVLVIACLNVSGLLLARSTTRRPEIAMRIALGAGRARIARQLLTESVLLALFGGATSLLVCHWSMSAVAAMTPQPGAARLPQTGVNIGTVGVTALFSILAGVAFGLIPAVASLKESIADRLNGSTHGLLTHSGKQHLRALLISGQLALAFMLVIGFGLMMKSFVRLAGRDLNFDPNGLLSVDFRIPQQFFTQGIGSYRDSPFYEIKPNPSVRLQRVLERLRELPGVVSVAGATFPHVNSLVVPSGGVIPENGRTITNDQDGASLITSYFFVTPGFFDTLRSPMLRGRDFNDHDTMSAAWVAIINETAARRFWPGENPLGKRFRLNTWPDEQTREVVGIVRDIPTRLRQITAEPVIYLSYLQHPSRSGPPANLFGQMTFVLRGREGAMSLAPAVRKAVAEIEPDRPLGTVAPVDGYIWARMLDFSIYVLVLGAYAMIAMLLASIGIYGVVAYSVSRRTSEIAIRAALGATARDIVALVGLHALVLTVIGLIAGFLGSLVLARLLTSQLWGVTSTDIATYVTTSLLLSAVALLACVGPARRAIKVDPVVALRSE